MENNTITAISGIRVGHYENREALRGVTVVRFPKEGAVASVDVRGSAPGTRETDLLDPINTIQRIHALVLTGGSAYGLESASGVMMRLEEERIGYPAGPNLVVPIVPAAVIFDLSVGDSRIRPTRDWGYLAALSASRAPVKSGNVGAGLGATVGKLLGADRRMKGGLGSFVWTLPDGIKVGALVVVNALGDVVDPKSGIIAGARGETPGSFADSTQALMDGVESPVLTGTNTTIGVVATNARLDKTQLRKMARMAHNGLAKTIHPAHTILDGDTIFAVSVPEESESRENPSVNFMAIAVAGEKALAKAILLGVKRAESIAGIPAYKGG